MLTTLLAVCSLSLVSQIQGQLPGRGTCPPVKPMTDLDPERISGVWYTRRRIDNDDEEGHTCSKLTFTANFNDTISIGFNGIIQPPGFTYAWEGLAIPTEQSSFGSYRLTYPKYAAEAEITITFLGTDYDHYAVGSTCDIVDGAFYQYAWIFGRSRTIDTHMDEAVGVWNSNGIPLSALSDVDQANCPN